MSSSKKKQLRKEQYMTERQVAAAQEAKKLKRYTLTFWVVIALVASIFIGAVVSTPIKNVIYKNTDAIQIGDHTLTSVEANYFFIDAVNTFVNQYGSYISYSGLNTSKPLDEQIINKETGATWADSFMTSAQSTIKSTYALYDLAVEKGHKLTEDEEKTLESTMSTMKIYAQIYGYSSLDAYLRSVYGNGSNEESYREYLRVSALATSYYNKYSEDLEFTAEELEAFQAKKPYEYNSYTFASYYYSYTKFLKGGTKGDDDKITYSDEEKKAAREEAKKYAEKLADGNYETVKDFDKAIQALDKEITGSEKDSTAASTKNEDLLYSKVNSLFRDWIVGKVEKEDDKKDDAKAGDSDKEDEENFEIVARKEGEMTVIESSSGSGDSKVINGYYVLRYEGFTNNDFAMKNVRHILVAFKGGTKDSSGNTTYSAAEKLAAKKEAEQLLKQWKDGKATEDSFAELANKESDDNNGKVTNGGLYEDIYPGQMVTNFNDWCYDDLRQSGDTGIVETEYGYHVMYFVGNSETNYREYMITEALRADRVETWYNALTEKIVLKVLTDKHIKTDLVLG